MKNILIFYAIAGFAVLGMMLFSKPEESEAKEPSGLKTAAFAGGCFWGVEHPFRQVPGVLSAESGYTGGTKEDPTYREVCTGKTGHAEAVQIVFDAKRVSYEKLARMFFEIHDPTQRNRQGPDVGSQYRSAVFYTDETQKRVAGKLIGILRKKGYDVATEVTPAGRFWPAEEYHQEYFTKHPGRNNCHAPVKRFD
jgi:peptide methionine sulfoxide reductase msrA/msrB